MAILDGTIATGFKGLDTNYCIWCGTGPTVSALGVAPDGLEDKAADARRSIGQNGLLGQLQTLALTVGVGLNRPDHHLIRIDGAKSAVLNT